MFKTPIAVWRAACSLITGIVERVPSEETRTMRMRTVLRNVAAVGVVIASVGLIHQVRNRFIVNTTVDRAFPELPETFRDDLESAIMLAPLAAWFDRMELRGLQFIGYPYLEIERRNSITFDNQVQRRVFAAQERQGLAPKAVPGGVVPLDGTDSLKSDSLWQLGNAMYAAWDTPAGQQFLSTLEAPSDLARSQDTHVTLLRAAFLAAYGDKALRQAVVAP